MDGDRFDDIARALASGRARATSRRTFLAGLAGGALAAAGLLPAHRAEAQVSQAYCGNIACRNNPGKCAPGCVCCVHGNGNARCSPPDRCSPSAVACPAGQRFCPNLGRCAACCAAADCAGTTPPCQTATCTGGVCGGTPVGDGAPGACAGGHVCCGGGCTPLGTSANCGSCGNACDGLGETCGGGGTSGVCGCTDDGTACAGRGCGTAVNNCGSTVSCGPLGGGCPSGQSCQAGACVCPTGTCGAGCALALCPDGSCKRGATGACTADGDCCSGVCVAGVCLGGCVAEGGVCDSGTDCCAGACVTPGGGGPRLCCASGTACGATCCAGAAQVCDLTGACCTPATCQPGACGPRGDGCGRGLDCGGCTQTGETCGGGGTPGVCGSCTPADPATVCAGKCGTVQDGCGGNIECSTCGGGLHCCNGACVNLSNDVDNCRECGRVCESDPETCTSATCQGGECVFSVVLNCCQRDDQCSDADPCTVSTCDPRTLTCRHDRVAANTPCGISGACCDGVCIDVLSDPANCGACDNTCTENQACEPCSPGEICPDRGPGCCETGTCSAGRCGSILPICAACATPLCDPDLGAICVDNCPPPDACHTGAGVCQFDGSCTYEPTCSSCQECDPNTGTCSESPCGFDEFCVEGECVDGVVCLYLGSGDGVLCHPNDTCDIVSLTPPQTGCCPADATRCPFPFFGDHDLCCPAGDTCETQTVEGTTIPRCSSAGSLCPPLGDETAAITCLTNETCAVTIDLTSFSDQSICCPADGVLCGDYPSSGRPLCCPAGDTCGTTEILGVTYPTCSSIGNFCPNPNGGPATICDPDDTCAFTKLGTSGIEVGCCPPDGVICTLIAPDLPGGSPGVPDFELPEFELCCPAGDTCTFELAGLIFFPRCSSSGGVCPGTGGLLTCAPGEACAITTFDESTGAAEFGCCPAGGVICDVGDLEGIPSFLALCCPAGDSCETVSGPGSFPRCSSTPAPV